MVNGMNKKICEICENEFDISDLIPITELSSVDGLIPNFKLTPNTEGANKKTVYRCSSCWAPFIDSCKECGKSGWINKIYKSADGIMYFCNIECKQKYLKKR